MISLHVDDDDFDAIGGNVTSAGWQVTLCDAIGSVGYVCFACA